MTTYLDQMADLDSIVCVDIETGGLEADLPITEIAYANVLQMLNPITIIPPHDTSRVGQWSRDNTGYLTRGLDRPENWCTPEDIENFAQAVKGKFILGSNPAFDTLRLSNLLGGNKGHLADLATPWKHRLIDVAGIGSYVLGYRQPQGILTIASDLREMGYEIPLPDHTAGTDVRSTWACYIALLDRR